MSPKAKFNESKEIRFVNGISLINDTIIYGYHQKELFFCKKSQEYCNSVEFSSILYIYYN